MILDTFVSFLMFKIKSLKVPFGLHLFNFKMFGFWYVDS